jgi:catechol 2,3-dioxygenase-like lactoylglutathione lyase family enzyme
MGGFREVGAGPWQEKDQMQHNTELGASVGVLVRDLEPVLDLYTEGIGLGPFEVAEVGGRGTRLRVASAPLGVCEMELIEVARGRPPHAIFLDEHGEGMNHFNLDKLTAEEYLATLGRLFFREIEPFWGLPFNSFCYVDSEKIGGVTFEVMVGSGHAGKKGHNHLGLVVADTDRTIEFYSKSMGLGPFRTGTFPMPHAFFHQDRIETSFKASFCDLGDTTLRVYQVLEGGGALQEHLDTKGEGMHHLSLNVASLDDTVSEMKGEGVEVGWSCPEVGLTLLDTTSVGGMTFSLTQAA